MYFSLCFVSSFKIGVSPPSIELYGKSNEEICSNFYLYSSSNSTIYISDRWSKLNRPSKDISYYSYNSSSLDLIVHRVAVVDVNSNNSVEVCFKSLKDGTYRGLILFGSQNGIISVGSWVTLLIGNYNLNNIIDDEFFPISFLTGNAISKSEKKLNSILVFEPFILLIILVFLLFLLRKKRRTLY